MHMHIEGICRGIPRSKNRLSISSPVHDPMRHAYLCFFITRRGSLQGKCMDAKSNQRQSESDA